MLNWIIVCKSDPSLCWSNSDGWTEDNYDTFDEDERAEVSLPIDGEWERVPWRKES